MMRGSILLLTIFIGLQVGCDQQDGDEITVAELTAALVSLVEGDAALDLGGLADDGLFDDDYDQPQVLNKALQDTIWPRMHRGVRWGRFITDRSIEVHLDRVGLDTVDATITGSLSGFIRAGGWNFGPDSAVVIADTLSKPFQQTTTRRVRFLRVGSTGDLRQDWRIGGLTAVLGTAGSKVSLQGLRFSLSGDTTTYFHINRDELLDRFFDRENLPHFRGQLPVAMYVTVDNAGPLFPLGSGERVLIRHGRGLGRFSRALLNDQGLLNDVKPLDDIFSGYWRPHQRPQQAHVFRLYVEVLDLASLFVPEEAFHSEFIGLPYLIAPDPQSPF